MPGMKYDLRKVEEVYYDVKIRGLADKAEEVCFDTKTGSSADPGDQVTQHKQS